MDFLKIQFFFLKSQARAPAACASPPAPLPRCSPVATCSAGAASFLLFLPLALCAGQKFISELIEKLISQTLNFHSKDVVYFLLKKKRKEYLSFPCPPLCVPGAPHQGATYFSVLRSFQAHSIEGASFFSTARLLISIIDYTV